MLIEDRGENAETIPAEIGTSYLCYLDTHFQSKAYIRKLIASSGLVDGIITELLDIDIIGRYNTIYPIQGVIGNERHSKYEVGE